MKTSDAFKRTIEAKLQEMAAADELFATNLQKEGKNIDDCITFILNSVKKSECNGFTDDEIFGMAAHYYDEDNIDIGNPMTCHVVVNHIPELTEEEIQQAKDEAKKQVFSSELERLRKKSTSSKPESTETKQSTLF